MESNYLIQQLDRVFSHLQVEEAKKLNFFIRPHLELGNGTILSIQGSQYHYSHPKESLQLFSEYQSLELMIIQYNQSTKYQRLVQDGYAESDFLEYNQVCEYVPVEVLLDTIKENGGLIAFTDKGNRMLI